MFRFRINFDKTEAMRFTGHLDLYRTWERALQRAGLPVAYSQGFKPHPRIQIAAALPLGFTSSNDLMDIWLQEELPLPTLAARIQAVLPPGLQVNEVTQVPLNLPALQSVLKASEYRITFLEYIPNLSERIGSLIQENAILVTRKGKTFNLRPLILSVEFLADHVTGFQYVHTLLRTNATLHARPDELVQAMGIPPEKALFHRLRLHFTENNISIG